MPSKDKAGSGKRQGESYRSKVELYCIIQANSACMKFGISANPKKRLRSLQTGSPYPLTLIFSVPMSSMAAVKAERELHSTLVALPMVRRLSGEWFEVTPCQWGICVQDYAFYWLCPEDSAQDSIEEPYADFLAAIGQPSHVNPQDPPLDVDRGTI